MKYVWLVIALMLACAAAGLTGGWFLGNEAGAAAAERASAQAVADARVDASRARTALARVEARLDAMRSAQARAAAVAAEQMRQRAQELAAREAALQDKLKELSDAADDEGCAALVDLPLCAGVARELFPGDAAGAGADGGGG